MAQAKSKNKSASSDDSTQEEAVEETQFLSQPSSQSNPYRSEDEQGDEMTPVLVGPPAYGSPDPLSSTGRLVPLDQHPQADEIADTTYGEGYTANLTAEETLASSPGPGTGSDDDAEEKATQAAQDLADENDVDLADVEGTGKDGNVTKSDVQNYIDERDAADGNTDDDQS